MVIRQITESDSVLLSPLCELLMDTVNYGASVGFLAPMTQETAMQYWRDVFAALGTDRKLWVAEVEGTVVGAVQLALSEKENARHRAEVQKLVVLRAHRGKGIASQLMHAVEGLAAAAGRTLLVLDTEAGSVAESLYRRWGWQRVGEIPNYFSRADGKLYPTVYYFKQLSRE